MKSLPSEGPLGDGCQIVPRARRRRRAVEVPHHVFSQGCWKDGWVLAAGFAWIIDRPEHALVEVHTVFLPLLSEGPQEMGMSRLPSHRQHER